LAGKYLRTEENERICMEDGDTLIDEENSENGIVSFVPLGSRFNTINTISEQNTYRITYHMKDETNNDDILMEDNSGSVLMEESIKEGLRISDLEHYYPKFYVSEYDNHKNLRTNLTFNAYVKSATA
jgi:opacity protein-like surface antigen